jgi:hypothetical protein
MTMRLRTDSGDTKGTRRPPAPAGGIGAADALFAALADMKTADFIRAVFSGPEQRPAVTTEKTESRLGARRFWEVAIIEKPRVPAGLKKPLLNVAHVVVDAGNGRVRARWFLTKVRDDEYRDFLRAKFPRPAGCKGQTR